MYAIYRACERFCIPPADFYSLNIEEQRNLLAYNSIREHEETDILLATAGTRAI